MYVVENINFLLYALYNNIMYCNFWFADIKIYIINFEQPATHYILSGIISSKSQVAENKFLSRHL